MKKKVVYQITRHKFAFVEVETEEQEKIIKELNRNFECEDKRSKTAQRRCVSLNFLNETMGFELKDDKSDIEELCLLRMEQAQLKLIVHEVLLKIKPRYRKAISLVYMRTKTQREAAKDMGIKENTFSELLKRALIAFKKEFLKIKN